VDASAVLSNLSGPAHTNRCHKFAFSHVTIKKKNKTNHMPTKDGSQKQVASNAIIIK
jgi:hypothetical protein